MWTWCLHIDGERVRLSSTCGCDPFLADDMMTPPCGPHNGEAKRCHQPRKRRNTLSRKAPRCHQAVIKQIVNDGDITMSTNRNCRVKDIPTPKSMPASWDAKSLACLNRPLGVVSIALIHWIKKASVPPENKNWRYSKPNGNNSQIIWDAKTEFPI